MKHGWAALLFVLALSAFMPRVTAAQSTQDQSRDKNSGGLKQNFPNPFNPETRIPFTIGDQPCADQGKLYRVSLRIYNLLTQLVAVPVLQGGTSGVAGGQKLENVMLTCGDYMAYWDGKDQKRHREVASGVYLYQLDVNGRIAHTKKMMVTK
jgi:hypothetical protein